MCVLFVLCEYHHPRHGYLNVKYPCQIEPVKLVFPCFDMISAATKFGALSASSLQNDQNMKAIMSLLLQSRVIT